MIFHVDMDSFYVSVERLKDPGLIGLPVVVGGSADGRGVVASASYEAREFGVRSAMPMATAMQLCPKLVRVSGTFADYRHYSRQIEETMKGFTPLVQMASQDEAYLDMTGTDRLNGPPLVAAQKVRDAILTATSLPCSLGVASNKLVAKIASGLCKPRGMLFVPAGSEARFLAPLPVKKLPGIGGKSIPTLESLGIKTVGDLAASNPDILEKRFGEWGREMVERAQGISNSAVIIDGESKSIGAEETFDKDSIDAAFLDRMLSALVEKVTARARKAGYEGETVAIKYRYGNFETHTAAVTLPYSTADEQEMLEAVRTLFFGRWTQSRAIRLLGVSLRSLVTSGAQLDLLNEPRSEKRKKIQGAVDAIRGKHGFGHIRKGSSVGED
ncbi:DNA polymerase IV [soil metagenome]